jgi:uncharacterized protein
MKDISQGQLDEIVKRLVEALQPELIYLFGSHAYGTPSRDSDVDLLIVVPDGAGDTGELSDRGQLAMRGLLVPMDILVFHRKEWDKWVPVQCSLQCTVAKKGKRLYESSRRISQNVA